MCIAFFFCRNSLSALAALPGKALVSVGVVLVKHVRFRGPQVFNGYNGYNGGWPSARLFGWSATDWSRPATNKSVSSERKSLVFCWERKSWTSWLLTCCSKKGWAAEKSSKKGVNRKENCFLSSQTQWSWQNKRACNTHERHFFRSALLSLKCTANLELGSTLLISNLEVDFEGRSKLWMFENF